MKSNNQKSKQQQEAIVFHDRDGPKTPVFMFKEVKRSFLPHYEHENKAQFVGSTMDKWIFSIYNRKGEYRVKWKRKIEDVASEVWLDEEEDTLYVGTVNGNILKLNNRNAYEENFFFNVEDKPWKPIQLLYKKDNLLLAISLSNMLYGFVVKSDKKLSFSFQLPYEFTAYLTIYNPFLKAPCACVASKNIPPFLINKVNKLEIQNQLEKQMQHHKENSLLLEEGEIFQLAYTWSDYSSYLCAGVLNKDGYSISVYHITQERQMFSGVCYPLFEVGNVFQEIPLHYHINIYDDVLMVAAWNKFLFYDMRKRQIIRKIDRKNKESDYLVCWGFVLSRNGSDVNSLSFRGLPFHHEKCDDRFIKSVVDRMPSLHFPIIEVNRQ